MAQVVGCGTSTLSEDLLGAGYEKVTSADIDAAQVAHMQDKTQESHPGLAWVVADMTKCEEELPDAEAFELIFDKARPPPHLFPETGCLAECVAPALVVGRWYCTRTGTPLHAQRRLHTHRVLTVPGRGDRGRWTRCCARTRPLT